MGYNSYVKIKNMEYKVGKKYRSSSRKDAIIWTCVWHSISGNALFEHGLGLMIVYPEDTFWEEVKEKITVTKYVHWFRKTYGNEVWCFTSNDSTVNFIKDAVKKENYIKTDVITCEVEQK